jgi:hypothetical protein
MPGNHLPDGFEFPSVFVVSYDPETEVALVDSSLLPDFDERLLGKEQVSELLRFALPALYEMSKVSQDLLHGRLDPTMQDPLFLRSLQEFGIDPDQLSTEDVAGFQLERYNATAEATDWANNFLQFLDMHAPIRDETSWHGVITDALRSQTSPMFTEDNPVLRQQQIAYGLVRKREHLDRFIKEIGFLFENPEASIADMPDDYETNFGLDNGENDTPDDIDPESQ